MEAAFREVGVDAYCSWTWAPEDSFAQQFDRAMFRMLTDTGLVGEALSDVVRCLGDTSPFWWRGRRAQFRLFGDSAVMVRSQMTMTAHGSPLHGYSVGVTEGNGYSAACFTGAVMRQADYRVSVNFPGAGTWDCLVADDAEIVWLELATTKLFHVGDGCVGVSGTITVDQLDEELAHGTFSGTLGYWVPPHDPSKVPPDEVLNVTEGFFKRSGRRYSGDARRP